MNINEKNILINLELKNSIIHYEGIEDIVYSLIQKYNLDNKVIISSFNHYSIKNCIYKNSNIKTGILYDACLYEPYNYIDNIDANAIHPESHSVTYEIVSKCHEKDIDVNIYTVNSEEDMKRIIDLKVDGMITNYPNLLNNIL